MDDREDVIGTILSVVAIVCGVIGFIGGIYFPGELLCVGAFVITIAGLFIAFKARKMMFNSRSFITVAGIIAPIVGIVFSAIGVKDWITML